MFENSPIIVYNRIRKTIATCEEAMAAYNAILKTKQPGTLDHTVASRAWFGWLEEAERAEAAIEKLIRHYTH